MDKTTKPRLSVLNNIQKRDVIRRLACNEKISTLAKKFNVSEKTIRRIKAEKENNIETSTSSRPSILIRKPQINLSIKSKEEIIKKLAAGHDIAQLTKEYSVSESTIRRIKKNKQKIFETIQNLKEIDASLERRKLSGAEDDPLDKALYTWFKQKRSLGESVSGEVLQAKAILLNEKINGPNTIFKASQGWLHNFKQRHGIRQLVLQGEKQSADHPAAENFKSEFSKFLQENNYDFDQVYNADETGLYWRSLPKKTLVAGFETSASGYKDIKDRVTVMCCANATGTHKIPLFVIGKSHKPRCFRRNLQEKLPVMYAGQKSAWMDRRLFMDWYKNSFLPEVRLKHPDLPQRPRKVLLLLDNAPSHPPLEELNAIDATCQIKYLPPNATAVIQPMDQGVIEKMKRMYRKQLLKEMLLRQEEVSIVTQLKNQTILHCCYRIASSWNLVTPTNLRNAWNPVLGNEESCIDPIIRHDNIVQLLSILHNISEYKDCTYENVKLWIEEDYQETGWEVLDIEKILERIQSGSNNEQDSMNVEEDPDDTSNDELNNDPEPEIPSIHEAFEGLIKFRTWFQTRFECDRTDLGNVQILMDKTLDIAYLT